MNPRVGAIAVETGKEEELAQDWRRFKEHGDPEARERLILAYANLVKYVAGRVAVALPPHVEMDDLISYGVFGLVDAIEKFDAARGVKFETYALSRVKGAIIDGLRATDWVPRSVRQKARELEQVIGRLEARLGRAATDEEVCAELGLTPSEYHLLLAEVRGAALCSLDELWTADPDDESTLAVGSMVQDRTAEDPSESVEEQEMHRLLAQALRELPERERLVLTLYYYEELTLKEIGQVLGVTESRVSQIHTQAILRLRGRIRPLVSQPSAASNLAAKEGEP